MKRKTPPIERVEIKQAEIEALLEKIAPAVTTEELQLLRQMIETLQFVTNELDKKRVSVARLKNLLFGAQTEKTKNVRKLVKELLENAKADSSSQAETDTTADSDQTAEEKDIAESSTDGRQGHGRRSAKDYPGAEQNHVSHPTLKHKDPCPECGTGKVYKQKHPKVVVRITGSAPIQAKVWSYDWFRCNQCDSIFKAPLPPEAGADDKYDESATATIGVLRYGSGMPWNRLEKLQSYVEIPLPSSTQWDLIYKSAPYLEPVFLAMMREAATGDIFYNDDTTARVLELLAIRQASQKKEEPGGKKERNGIFTTGIISKSPAHTIALYLTGHEHAGENLEKVLAECEPDRGTVIQMSDGLSCNVAPHLPPGLSVIHANCLSHGRRKYVDIVDEFPEQCLHVLRVVEQVYKNESVTRKAHMRAQERLAYHQQHSGPLMTELKEWLQTQLDAKLVEPNSPFGEATKYMLKRWEKLTRFLTVAGAPLDNNICERALKKAIRHRKNSLFYKSMRGARMGDIYMSFIHTCELNGVNPLDYLTAVLRAGKDAAKHPEQWMPWNYTAQDTTTAASAK